MELQIIQQQSGQIQQQLQILSQQKVQIEAGIASIKALKEGEILLPILQGIFLKAKIEKIEGMVVNLGNNICVEKSPADTAKMLEGQVEEITKIEDELLEQINEHSIKVKEIEKELENVQKAQG